MQEENIIGSDYKIHLRVEINDYSSLETDRLADTMDYVTLLSIIKKEMQIPSKLLEHVAERIMKKLLAFQNIQSVQLKICKLNPPINGDVKEVCFDYFLRKVVS